MARLDQRIAALELQRAQVALNSIDTYRHISPEQAAEGYQRVMIAPGVDGGRRAFADVFEAQQGYLAMLGRE